MTFPRLAFIYGARDVIWGGIGMLPYLTASGGPMAAVLERCARMVEARLGWSLEETLNAGVERISQDRIDVAVAAVQLALTEGWRGRGVVPDAVCARSGGEPAAEFARGCLTLENAMEAPIRWSRIVQERGGHAAVLMVRASIEEAAALRHASPVPFFVIADATDAVSLIACERAALRELAAWLATKGVRHSATGFITAPHSPLVESWRQAYVEPPVEASPGDPAIAFYSCGAQAPDPGLSYAERMWRGVRAPTLMGRTLERMIADGYNVFVEIGGRAVLGETLQQRAAALGKRIASLPSMRVQQPAAGVMDEVGATLRRLGIDARAQ